MPLYVVEWFISRQQQLGVDVDGEAALKQMLGTLPAGAELRLVDWRETPP